MHEIPEGQRPQRISTAGASAEIWDAEWLSAWKAHRTNPWFAYEAEVYLDQLGATGPERQVRVLKTDAFDEACGRERLTATLGPRLVVADISPRIVRHAARALGGTVAACAADVRRLPFRSSTFDVVLSTSTLDHFDERREITVALTELERVLGPDGRLFLTLDNPANPLLRLRQLVYAVTGAVGGLIPFRMGLTLSRQGLVEAARDAGLEVHESGYLIHAPRVLGLWVGEWAARCGTPGGVRRLEAWLAALERTARRLPTRRWTAHFIYADCRPRVTPSGRGAATAAVRLPRWLRYWKAAEHRLRYAYLRRVPTALLARVDPPLRRAAALGRRAAALPVYLHQPLDEHLGHCDGAATRIAVWSARHAPHVLFDVLLDDRPTVTAGASQRLGIVQRHAATLAPTSDLLIAHTTPALAPGFQRAGFHIVPGMVRFGGEPGALLAALAHPTPALVGDFRRLKHAAHRVELWSHTRARSRLFFYRYLMPHAQARFDTHAEIPPFAMIDRLFAAGAALAIFRAGQPEPDIIGLVLARGESLVCLLLGTRDGDPAILPTGAMAALYLEQIRLAHARGLRIIDVGRCLPWASNGVAQYKWKWGFRPIPDGGQTLEYAVKVLRPESPAARRLVERGVIIRAGRSYRPFTAADVRGARDRDRAS